MDDISELTKLARLYLQAHDVRIGNEVRARQIVVVELGRLRDEGYSFEEIAELFFSKGVTTSAAQLDQAVKDIVLESLFELVRTADEFERQCAQCPLGSKQKKT